METGIHELTAGYALDALDREERVAYEAHLAGCASCREELSAFLETTEALAVATSGPVPDTELRDRILGAARAEPQVVVPLALGLWAARLSSDLDRTRSALERQRSAAAVLADPAAKKVSLSAGEGRLLVDGTGRAVLVLGGLDAAPPGKTYETWIIAGGKPTPAGLFPGGNRVDVVGVDGVVAPGDVVAVTIERDGGATKPSSTPIVASSPV
jgi:anti-sigma-K factor RskA